MASSRNGRESNRRKATRRSSERNVINHLFSWLFFVLKVKAQGYGLLEVEKLTSGRLDAAARHKVGERTVVSHEDALGRFLSILEGLVAFF